MEQSTEVTRMMLGNGTHRRIVASTLAEIRGALQLAKDGILDEVLLPGVHFVFDTV